MAAKDKKNGATIVIKKEEVVEGGHHGGAWKVAYADFVTAMMAFFLLMWLLNATTEAQRKGLADYFTPTNIMSRSNSGSGMPFGGKTPFDDGSQVSDKGAVQVIEGRAPPPPEEEGDSDQFAQVQTKDHPKTPGPTMVAGDAGKKKMSHGNADTETDQEGEKAPGGGVARAASQTPSKSEFLAHAGAGTQAQVDAAMAQAAAAAAAARQAAELREKGEFEQAAQQIRQAVAADPALADLGRQLSIDITPDGLRVQLLDEDQEPMFQSGSATPSERARLLLQKVAPVLARLPEQLILTGHTDASPFGVGGRTNWELSADRANATRRVLVEAGLPDDHFKEVAGRADRDPLLPADPLAAANRRIAIVVQTNFRAQ